MNRRAFQDGSLGVGEVAAAKRHRPDGGWQPVVHPNLRAALAGVSCRPERELQRWADAVRLDRDGHRLAGRRLREPGKRLAQNLDPGVHQGGVLVRRRSGAFSRRTGLLTKHALE